MSKDVGRACKTVLLFVMFSLLAEPEKAFAYRPFDSTDAAVTDLGEFEVEFGPVGFLRDDSGKTLIAPAVVFNYGFAKNWELVLEGKAEHPLSPAEDNRSRFVEDAISLKTVLREGVLQRSMVVGDGPFQRRRWVDTGAARRRLRRDDRR